MASPFIGLEVEKPLRPTAAAFKFDLDTRLSSVVALEAKVSDDASTAEALGVESQQVVWTEGQSADGCLIFDAAVRTMPVIFMKPRGQLVGALT